MGMSPLGVVEQAPSNCGFKCGDLVVGIVSRPDPLPCAACAIGEWDMCRNGRYTERGIKQRNGYGSEYFRVEPNFLVNISSSLGNLGVLLEPASTRRVPLDCWHQAFSRNNDDIKVVIDFDV